MLMLFLGLLDPFLDPIELILEPFNYELHISILVGERLLILIRMGSFRFPSSKWLRFFLVVFRIGVLFPRQSQGF